MICLHKMIDFCCRFLKTSHETSVDTVMPKSISICCRHLNSYPCVVLIVKVPIAVASITFDFIQSFLTLRLLSLAGGAGGGASCDLGKRSPVCWACHDTSLQI
jgi:hypothetical protein